MAEIKLASGKKVKEIRAFINGRWTKTKGRVFYRGKWEEFSRPEIQMIDNIKTIEMARVLKNTASISGDKYIIDTITNYNLTHNIFPSFYDSNWSLHSTSEIINANTIKLKMDKSQKWSDIDIDVEEGARYRFTADVKKGSAWVILRNLSPRENYINSTSSSSWNRTFTPIGNSMRIRIAANTNQEDGYAEVTNVVIKKIT